MDVESRSGEMDPVTKDIGRITWRQASGGSFTQMETPTKGSGNKIGLKALVIRC